MTKKLYLLSILTIFAFLLTGCFALQEAEGSSGAVVAPTLAAVDAATGQNASGTVYTIDAARSEARFSIDEVLRGSDFTVVGVTNNVAGQVALDVNNPAAAQMGAIVINARDLATDDDFRNNAIRNRILLTDNYEFITFTPKTLVGLPDSVTVGQPYDLQIVGDLTMAGQMQEVTFAATVTLNSATEMQGTATAVIAYADWGVRVPLSQTVTAVADQVTLELAFVAVAP
ncbi:MAG: YceI family protein [Anaerolinea sp.]|nr:YceI family protein [Anaerolinea sp.]